jgi:hypothetical protein
MIAGRREKDLGLMLEPPERLAVNDAIAVALKRRPHVVFNFRAKASPRSRAFRGLLRENLPLACFQLLSERHLEADLSGDFMQEARAMRDFSDVENISKRLTEIGKRASRAEIDAATDARPGD